MIEEQIIELAKEHLEVLVADDDEMEFPTDFAATGEQLIAFADKIYLTGWREAYEVCLNKLNPSIENLMQSTIIDKLKKIASQKTCYEMYGDFYDGIPQPTTRIFTDGIDYGKINFCRELLKDLGIE